jgi:hypothetical protein
MGSPTVDDSATPDNGLLARPQHDHDFKFVARTTAELCAHIASEIAAARCGPAPVRCDPSDDDELELVEHVPVPVPRRQRKRSLSKVCEAAGPVPIASSSMAL